MEEAKSMATLREYNEHIVNLQGLIIDKNEKNILTEVNLHNV